MGFIPQYRSTLRTARVEFFQGKVDMVGMWLTRVSTTFFFVVPKECHKREANCATADTNKRCSWLRAPDLENGSMEQTISWDACPKSRTQQRGKLCQRWNTSTWRQLKKDKVVCRELCALRKLLTQVRLTVVCRWVMQFGFTTKDCECFVGIARTKDGEDVKMECQNRYKQLPQSCQSQRCLFHY